MNKSKRFTAILLSVLFLFSTTPVLCSAVDAFDNEGGLLETFPIESAAVVGEGFIEPVTPTSTVPDGFTPIYSSDDLNNIRYNLSGKYILMNDIDLSGYSNWEPIGSGSNNDNLFTGTFNGNGYSINNLKIYIGSSNKFVYAGLFGYIYKADIKNIELNSVNLSFSSSSLVYLGGLTGASASSKIRNCYSSGKIKLSSKNNIHIGGIVGGALSTSLYSCRNDTAIEGYSSNGFIFAGGILGLGMSNNSTFICNCINSGTVSVASASSSNVGGADAGGIAGFAYLYLNNNYNSGNISTSSSGSESNAGGIVGKTYKKSKITNCKNDGEIISSSNTYKSTAGGITAWAQNTDIAYCSNGGVIGTTSKNNFAYSGGIAGEVVSSIISDCYNTEEVSAVIESTTLYFAASGGIVGNAMSATINNSYNIGSISALRPSGIITTTYPGGILGYSSISSTLSHCYYLTYSQATGSDDSIVLNNVESLSEDEMKLKTSFVGFDFSSVWDINGTSSYKYPVLRSSNEDDGLYLNLASVELKYKAGTTLIAFSADDDSVTWSSSDTSVVTVNDSGDIVAVGSGPATITATSVEGNKTVVCTVTVKLAWWQWIVKIILFGWIWY